MQDGAVRDRQWRVFVAFNGPLQRFRFSWIESITAAHPSYFGWIVTDWQSVVERFDGSGEILVAVLDSLFDLVTDCGHHDWSFEYVNEKFDRVCTGVITDDSCVEENRLRVSIRHLFVEVECHVDFPL